MKVFVLLMLLHAVCLGYGQDSPQGEKRRLISYETKIFHKIPDHTIQEKKVGVLKTSIVLEEKAEKVEAKVEEKGEEKLEEKLEEKEEEREEEKVEEKAPSYEFGYGVKDPVSGDHKDQWEKRHGHRVKGGYRFDESDGTQRVVEYKADGKRGFEATVKNVERKEETAEAAEESGSLKEGNIAHSYSYLKRSGN